MSPISTVSSSMNALGLNGVGGSPLQIGNNPSSTSSVKGASFSTTIQNLISDVSGKEAQAEALTNNVIPMQEASVSLSLMVQVRNKLVESYQELMRMSV